MEISLLQALALGILAFIAGLDMFNGLTHMHRPVVLGPLVGLILGDAPRDKCVHFREINGIAAAFHPLQKNYNFSV